MKARDIIAGWPRGRSTSRPYPAEMRYHVFVWSVEDLAMLHAESAYTRFQQRMTAERIEEARRREEWYRQHPGLRPIVNLEVYP